MKKLLIIAAISLPLFLMGCTNNDQDILPVSPQFEKTSGYSSFPFEKYQSFPELTGAKVTWSNNAKGLSVRINQPAAVSREALLFAVIEFDDRDNIYGEYKMAYLGRSSKGIYLISGIQNRSVGSIRVYSYYTGFLDRIEPYPESQLFNSIGIDYWGDLLSEVKVTIGSFPNNTNCVFAELTCSESSNTLMFLCKPEEINFVFPKSPLLRVENLRLFSYCKSDASSISYKHNNE
jgi:hypothetical protein